MDSAEAALYDLAALEETKHQSEEADSEGDCEGQGLHLGLQWARSLVELGSITHAFRVSSQMVHSAGTHQPTCTASMFSELVTNRRMPSGTYGGVRGWGREAPAYSIPLALPRMTFLSLRHALCSMRSAFL